MAEVAPPNSLEVEVEVGPGAMTSDMTSQTPSPSPQVLQNEDLMDRIFAYFEPEVFLDESLRTWYVDQSTRKQLLFACLTCRAFAKPALDLLWRNMESLTPLFKILPTFVKVNENYTFNGAIQPAHIKRFEMYGQKIRALRIESLGDGIAGHCIHRLSSMPNLRLFPALKRIVLLAHLGDRNGENLGPLFLAYGSLLTSITIGRVTSINKSLMSSFLLHLSHRTPHIQEIDLCGELSSEILDFLKIFRRLQSVRLKFDVSENFPMSAVLQDLHDLPDLRCLYMDVNGNNLGDSISLIKGESEGFQALRSLDLRGRPTQMLRILHFICEAPSLRDISCNFTTNQTASPASVESCITESCRIAPNLKNFQLEAARIVVIPPGPDHSPSSSRTLDPLMQCRQLCSLHISKNFELSIDDDKILEFCERGVWQNLRILYLPPPCNQGPTTSLTTLRILAQKCPNLTSLTLPIDFTWHNFSSLQEQRSFPRANHPLQFLSITKMNGISHDSDPDHIQMARMAIAVARFLEHYFPNLGESKMVYARGDAQWWDIVKTNITEYRALRAEARAEAESETRQQLSIEA